MRKHFALILSAALLCSCGTIKNVSETAKELTLPTQEEASEIAASFVNGEMTTAPVQIGAGPRVFIFAPVDSTEQISVTTLGPENGQWTLLNTVAYPCFQEAGLNFKGFTEQASPAVLNGKSYIKFGMLRDNDKLAERTIVMYEPETDNLEYVSFSGKYLSDGRIEGRSNIDLISGSNRPEILWANSLFESDSTLVTLAETDILTDQAIEWWLKNNPSAQTKATKVTYGTLPAESSLVSSYQNAKKQNGSGFSAALFNIRGYTVVVGYRKSNGNYLLLWAEPVCKNKNTDNYLNNIYFRGDNTLVLFYYKGKKTFNYQINLSNAKLMR